MDQEYRAVYYYDDRMFEVMLGSQKDVIAARRKAASRCPKDGLRKWTFDVFKVNPVETVGGVVE